MNQMEPKIECRKVRDFSQTINDSFTFIKQNFSALFKPLIYICGFFILATIASGVLQQLKTIRILGIAKASQGFQSYSADFSTYAFGLEYFLLILFSILTVSAIYLVTFCYIRRYKELQNTPPAMEDVWTLFKEHALRFFLGTILLSVLTGIGFLFCLLPGFYLMPVVTLALPIMVMENLGISDSFSRSIALLKDNWWRTFGLVLVAGLIAYFSMSILGIPAAVLNIGAVFIENSPNILFAGSIFSSFLTGISQLFYVLPAIVSALWYYSLSEEKDGRGLLDRIDSFGTEKTQGSTEWPEEEY